MIDRVTCIRGYASLLETVRRMSLEQRRDLGQRVREELEHLCRLLAIPWR